MPLMLTPEGVAVDVPADQVQTARNVGYKDTTPTQAAADLTRPESSAEGLGGAALAGATSLLSGATLGGSDVLIGAAAPQGDVAAVRDARAAHPIVSGVAGVAGVIAPALLTGGESLIAAPTAFASGAGRAAAGAAAEAGVGRVGAAVAGGTIEGALYGAGQGASELALSEDPLTVEHVASSLSSNMLFGAGVGAVAGGLGKAAELGLRRAKGAIDGVLERRLAKAKTPDEAIESGDLEHLDTGVLKKARDTEIERIAAEQKPQREGFVADLEAARKEALEKKIWNATAGRADRESATLGRGYLDADKRLDRLLKERVTLAEDPARALGPLRAQQQALEALDALRVRESAAWEEELRTAPERIRADLAEISAQPTLAERTAIAKTKGIKGETGPYTAEGLDNATERVIKQRYGDLANAERPRRLQFLDKVPEEISVNRDLQRVLEGVTAAPTSDKLTKIEAALEVLAQPKEPQVGFGAMVSAVAPFAGPVGAAAAAGNRVLGSFRKVAAAATTRLAKATSAFLGAAAPATKYATPLATKTLAAIRFSERDRHAPEAKATSLPELYKARTAELKQQVHVAADGTYQMRPEARAKMAATFDGVRMADPRLADRLETQGAARIEYLASIMPRLPDFGTVRIGPERRNVSELAMRSWARAAQALEDPHAVLEAAAHGRVTPEAAAAIRAVYPELLADFTSRVTSELPTLKKSLHPSKRLALSILSGQPIDPAMTPAILSVIQNMYASEPGTEGGTQAPRAQAQFGSVKRSDPGTASQQRQEHA